MLFFSACGSVGSTGSNDDFDPNIDPSGLSVFMFGTDYVSSGQLYSADFQAVTSLQNTSLTGLGSSATVELVDGLLYVLHDGFSVGSLDNVQIIDPSNSFSTRNQWSTVTSASGSNNPQDLIVMGNKAYISLYNPGSDDANVDASGNPADVIVMNLENGTIEDRISFAPLMNADGDVQVYANQMTLVDGFIYVCLQDLQSDFSHNTSGKIGVIDTQDNSIDSVLTLQGRNPVDIVSSTDGKKLFVAMQAPYDFSIGNFNIDTDFGGLEIVTLSETPTTELIADEDLGGYVERLSSGRNSVFAVVSQMDAATFEFTSEIVSLPHSSSSIDDVSTFLSDSSDIREIFVDPLDRLWVSRRSISADDGSASDPQVDVIDIQTSAAVGQSLVPQVPITSIVIGEI